MIAGGGLFATKRIDDAFAVVDVGAPGIEVLHENRPVGTTGPDGRLLMPDLRSYEPNRIAIVPDHLPVDAYVGAKEDIVVPADRSGVAVSFGVEATGRDALVTLRDRTGRVLPVGALGRIEGSDEPFMVGYDGEAYVRGLAAGANRFTIDLPDGGACSGTISFEPRRGSQVRIDDVPCDA